MLKLEATLIATTAMRPSRGGWSPDQGVDFIVRAPMRRALAVATAPIVARERASFLEADEGLPSETEVVRRHVSLAAEAAEAETAPRECARPLTRAWSSVARKLPGS